MTRILRSTAGQNTREPSAVHTPPASGTDSTYSSRSLVPAATSQVCTAPSTPTVTSRESRAVQHIAHTSAAWPLSEHRCVAV